MTGWWSGDLFVLSDPHYGHDNIVGSCGRPFADWREMDAAMIERHNAIVRPRDTWICVGDFAWRDHIRYKRKLNGHGILVTGNHDQMPEVARREFTKVIGGNREPGIFQTNIGDRYCVFCHFPMWSWNASFHGSWHFYGHCHGRKREDIPRCEDLYYPDENGAIPEGLPPPRIVESPMILSCAVDMDVWDFTPVPWEVLELKMKSREPAWRERMDILDNVREAQEYRMSPAQLAFSNRQWRARANKLTEDGNA